MVPHRAGTNGYVGEWRREISILVPDVQALGQIAVIRSLGRAGYDVHGCCGSKNSLGFRSAFCRNSVVCPGASDAAFCEWLRAYVRDHGIRVIVPSEGFLLAIEDAFEEFAPLLPLAQDPGIVYRAFSKAEVAETFLGAPPELGLAAHHPPSLVIHRGDPLPENEEFYRLGSWLFLKLDACHGLDARDGGNYRLGPGEDVRGQVNDLLERYDRVLVQSAAPGQKAAISVCLHNGEIVAESGVLAIHTFPHHGGMMSLRQSWTNEAMRRDALARLRHLGWEGVAMMEYLWESETDDFHLIEVNARYWGYLHLDLYSGVDMPRLQIDRFLGAPQEPPPKQVQGVVCRYTTPGETSHVLSKLRDNSVSRASKLISLMEFFLLFLHLGIRSDLFFPADRHLYWIEWKRFLVDLLTASRRRLRTSSHGVGAPRG